MVDFTSTQTQAKDLAPLVHQGEPRTEVVTARSPSTLPPLTTDGVNRMYHQLAEIHTNVVAQLEQCTRWHQADSTARSVRAGMSRPRPSAAPTTTRLAQSPPIDFLSQAPPWPRQGWCNEPQAHRQPHLSSSSVLPSRCQWSPWQGKQSNFFGSTFEESRDVITQHPINYEAVMHRPAPVSWEVTSSSDKEASGAAISDASSAL
jgi:hypothetical protein